MAGIIDQAIENTPSFIKGLLIPEKCIDEFLYLVDWFMKEAREGKKYFELMMEGEAIREKMKLDLITTMCENLTLDKMKVPKKDET